MVFLGIYMDFKAMKHPIKLFFFLFVMVSFLAACASSSVSESTGEYLDSSAVTAKVKTRLIDMLGRDAFEIKVRTYKNQVQLSGFVDREATKQRAGVVAAGTMGVDQVRNDLIVK